MKITILLFGFLFLFLGTVLSQSKQSHHHIHLRKKGVSGDIIGLWLGNDGKGTVQIYKKGEKYFGKLVQVNKPTPNNPKKLDLFNPDPKKRKNSLLGMDLMTGFEKESEGIYKNGRVYDFDSGKEFDGKLTLLSENELEVRGFIGIALIGKTIVLKRILK